MATKTVILSNRPDPTFYRDIIHHDDGNFEATARDVNDSAPVTLESGVQAVIPGVRSLIIQRMADEATKRILIFAPEYKQRNALWTIQTYTGRSDLTPQQSQDLIDANALWATINALRTYVNVHADDIKLLSFDQLLLWTMPTDWPPSDLTVSTINAYTSVITSSATNRA